jgi:hypothetical protein
MNKQERTKIKKRVKKLYWWAYSLALTGVLVLVLALTTKLGDFLRTLFNHDGEFLPLLAVGLFVLVVIGPMLAGLGVGVSAKWEMDKLYQYRSELYRKQNKFHMKLFWEAVRSEDYKEACRLYNIDKFIWGSERVLCNGILMGIATQLPIDEDWTKQVDERMNGYL